MAFYITLTTTRPTPPDAVTLLAAIKSAVQDPTAVLVPLGIGTWRGKKNGADWTPADTAAAQTVLDTTPALTPQLEAQHEIDHLDLTTTAIVLTILDQVNVIRAALHPPRPAVTPTQAIAAIRAKAGTL